MAVPSAGERLNAQDGLERQPHLVRSPRTQPLLRPVPRALPGNKNAGRPQQRRRVLHQHRQRRHGTGRHGIVGLTPTPNSRRRQRPLLRPGNHAPCVLDPGGLSQPIDHRRLPPRRFDQINSRAWKRDRQHQTWEPRPGAEVRNASGAAQRLDLEPAQAVGDMGVSGDGRIADRGVRIGHCRQRVEQLGEPIGGGQRQRVARRQVGQRFP